MSFRPVSCLPLGWSWPTRPFVALRMRVFLHLPARLMACELPDRNLR